MSQPIVTIEEGQVQGKKATDYRGGEFYSFLGIPYGKAPVGELRFRVSFALLPECILYSWLAFYVHEHCIIIILVNLFFSYAISFFLCNTINFHVCIFVCVNI